MIKHGTVLLGGLATLANQGLSVLGWFSSYWLIGWMLVSTSHAQDNDKEGTYLKDPHVWVYSREFAERFGMPLAWVDEDLVGAQALAYRVELREAFMTCLIIDERMRCAPSRSCVMDMYLDDSLALPWNNPLRFDTSKYGRKSRLSLYSQERDDRPEYLDNLTWRGTDAKLGLDALHVSGNTVVLNDHFIREYNRDIYQGLDYLSVTMSCGLFGRNRDIAFHIDDPAFYDSGRVNYAKSTLNHAIALPNGFMQRIQDYDQAVKEPTNWYQVWRQQLKTYPKD